MDDLTVVGKTLDEWLRVLPHTKRYNGVLVRPIEEILALSNPDKTAHKLQFGGYMVNMFSLRYQTFKQYGCTCVRCGAQGVVMLLEAPIDQHTGPKKNRQWDGVLRAHFNMYGVRPDGEYVLMTKDHIRPLSLGGKDTLSNFQTMCSPCNRDKGSFYIPVDADSPPLPTLGPFPLTRLNNDSTATTPEARNEA